MAGDFRISAKKLGVLGMPDFCQRCFWIRQHMNAEPPFSVFPRIFNDLDGYTKKVVHNWFTDKNAPPPWLAELGDLTGFIEPPNRKRFQMQLTDKITLTGEADAIYKRKDGKLVIGDYKTAFCRGVDDPLYPIYYVQLNTYAVLAKHLDLGEVASLALIYTEPATGDMSARLKENRRDDGFAMGFRIKIQQIPLDPPKVSEFAHAAYKLYSLKTVPKGKDGCIDCERTQDLIDTINHSTIDFAKMFPAA